MTKQASRELRRREQVLSSHPIHKKRPLDKLTPRYLAIITKPACTNHLSRPPKTSSRSSGQLRNKLLQRSMLQQALSTLGPIRTQKFLRRVALKSVNRCGRDQMLLRTDPAPKVGKNAKYRRSENNNSPLPTLPCISKRPTTCPSRSPF